MVNSESVTRTGMSNPGTVSAQRKRSVPPSMRYSSTGIFVVVRYCSKTRSKSIPDSPGHHAEWIQACKTGGPTGSPFSYAGPLSEANHLGNVAYRAGRRLEWDATSMKFPNAPEAKRFLSREYRKGWSLT